MRVFMREPVQECFSDSRRILRFVTIRAGILADMTIFGKTYRVATKLFGAILLIATLCFALGGCQGAGANQGDKAASNTTTISSTASTQAADPGFIDVSEDGYYTSKDEVAAYIHEFGHLPGNYISKSKARKEGWVPSKGNLHKVCPGKSIGGSEFYNDDGQLPDARGRTWKECDINYTGGHRGAERIVFSNDGLVFYTPDHYRTFEQLY